MLGIHYGSDRSLLVVLVWWVLIIAIYSFHTIFSINTYLRTLDTAEMFIWKERMILKAPMKTFR